MLRIESHCEMEWGSEVGRGGSLGVGSHALHGSLVVECCSVRGGWENGRCCIQFATVRCALQCRSVACLPPQTQSQVELEQRDDCGLSVPLVPRLRGACLIELGVVPWSTVGRRRRREAVWVVLILDYHIGFHQSEALSARPRPSVATSALPPSPPPLPPALYNILNERIQTNVGNRVGL